MAADPAEDGPAEDGPAEDAARRHEALLRYVERFSLVMRASGIPPMPARVFAYVLAEDAAWYTAAELADGLRVSPAAISGAVRYLVQTGIIARHREPGTRSDLYGLNDDDVWSDIYGRAFQGVHAYEKAAREGIEIVGADTPGGRRLEETADFFAFLTEEYPALFDRWRARLKAKRESAT
jgi:predicted transcriptional regulator